MQDTTELRIELTKLYKSVLNKEIDVQSAKALVGASNAMLKSASLEMEHSKMTGSKDKIDFLTTPKS